uniref:Methyltransferase-like protein 13 n=2 Tax=Cacopsylla melanoneura TaxID=428564 RepID=A0A8D9EM28_9HEMI
MFNLLPKTKSEFTETDYWDKFFKKRGDKAFEWYGEYVELCSIINKYMKVTDNILNIGCGNSKLSADLYDGGFKNLKNIDMSEVVIKNMNKKYCTPKRPGLTFEQMDALNTTYDNEQFNVVLDKGTLDALMPDNKEDTVERIDKLFKEVDRLLKQGGRYIIISLLQEHIVRHLSTYFNSLGWMLRITRCKEAEHSAGRSLIQPVFVVVVTKFKKNPNITPVLEINFNGDKTHRVTSTDALISAVRTEQQVALLCCGLSNSNISSTGSLTLDVYAPGNPDIPRYTLVVIDKPSTKSTDDMTYAAFIIPQGRECEWTFSSDEGRQVLLANCKVDRLTIITLNRSHEFPDLKSVQDELAGTVVELAPSSIRESRKKVPFLSLGGDIGKRHVVVKGESEWSGGYVVEEVEGEDGILRRLIFMKTPYVIQSEIRLKEVTNNDGQIEKINDRTYLSCEYHVFLNLAVALLPPKAHILIVGLGGGVLINYIHHCFDQVKITSVEIDPAVYDVASKYFGLVSSPNIEIHITDGVDFILSEAQKPRTKYDMILFDVDNKDTSLGLSCPPKRFLEDDILDAVLKLVSEEQSLFMVNLVCRATDLHDAIVSQLQYLFPSYASIKMKHDVNEVIFCSLKPNRFSLDLFEAQGRRVNELTKSKDLVPEDEEELLDVKDMLERMEINS